MDSSVTLRPVEETDLANLVRLLWDPVASGEFQFFGFRVADARELERRWREDGLMGEKRAFLAVGLEDGSSAGWVTWQKSGEFGNYEIGAALFPEHRGRGIRTEAQRHLVDHLFRTTTAHRLAAGTEIDNTAERRSLEKIGFRQEGVLRGFYFRDGSWRDSVIYGLLRSDTRPD